MKILSIDACPRTESRSRYLLEQYLRRYHRDDTVEYLALPEEDLAPFYQDMLAQRNSDAERNDFSSPRYQAAKSFADADSIVIAAPFWDMNFPAILKIFFEHIFVCGLTFEYGEDGVPISHCRAKKLIYITTAGGFIPEDGSLAVYLRELCAFFDIEELRIIKAEGLDIRGNDVNAILASVVKGM